MGKTEHVTEVRGPVKHVSPRRSLLVRSAAAKVAVKATRKRGEVPEPALIELANATP